jgi:predicted Zn-dependent protease
MAIWTLLLGGVAAAQTVEVAPGIRVSKKSFSAPINEQPFFGFAEKTTAMRETDEKFVAAAVAAVGSRQKAVYEAVRRGWVLLSAGNFAEAAQRFNQAYLIDPMQSGVYHSFAVLVARRFNDLSYAEELFKVAKARPNPLPHLNGDYGRLLLILRRPREAQPLLERAVIDEPDSGTSWSNLGLARLQNDDREGACAAANAAARRSNPSNVQSDLAVLRSQARCN